MAKKMTEEEMLAACGIDEVSPTEGYDTIGRPDIDGWFDAKPGFGFVGKIEAAFNYKTDRGNLRDVVLVRIEKPARAVLKDQGGDPFLLEPGKILAVGVSYGIEQMLEYVENNGLVWAKVLERKKIDGGKSVIKWDCRVKGKRTAPPPTAPIEDEKPGANVGF